jgi:hypothetical protein
MEQIRLQGEQKIYACGTNETTRETKKISVHGTNLNFKRNNTLAPAE